MDDSRLTRFTVSPAWPLTWGKRAERAMLRSCSLCATPRLARITRGFCLSANWTASRKVSLRGAGSWAKAPAASASSIEILSFMADGNAPAVPEIGRQVIVFTWIMASRAGSAAHISAGADRVALPEVVASCLLGISGFILFGLGGKMASFGKLFHFRSVGDAVGFRTGLGTGEESSSAAAPDAVSMCRIDWWE